jgi:hypothetical protein
MGKRKKRGEYVVQEKRGEEEKVDPEDVLKCPICAEARGRCFWPVSKFQR